MARRIKAEMRCNKCGRPHYKNEEKSIEQWSVYDCDAKCECGGRFVIWLDGEPNLSLQVGLMS